MARLIQSTIKTPLADEVLFGKLRTGGAVRVVLLKSDTDGKDAISAKPALGFEFPAGPVTPKPEKDVTNAVKRHKRAKPRPAPKRKGGGGKDGGPDGPGGSGSVRSTVPKVPLVKA